MVTLEDMGTRKKSDEPADKAPKKARPNRTGASLHIWLDPKVREALDAYVEASDPRTSATAVVDLAIRRFLESVGAWPPQPDDEN